MKLLIYSHFFWPSVGGVETVVESLATGLGNLRDAGGPPVYEITVVTNTGLRDGVEPERSYRVVRNPTKSQLRELIRSSDIVHVAGVAIPPLREASRFKKPVVVEHHGFQAICPTGQLLQEPQDVPCPGHFMQGNHSACLRCRKSGSLFGSLRLWLLAFLRRHLCKQVDVNIVPTTWLGEQLKLPRVRTVPHGLPPRAPLVRISDANRIPRIVFVGRLVTTKGVGLLLEAARRLKEQNDEFEVLIIGTGPEKDELESRARQGQLDPRVKFLGLVPNEKIATHLAGAAVVVVPSIGGEVFGMVVAESMLHGLPVIASDLGAFVEVLGNAEQTFRTGDAQDLARKLARIIHDPAVAADWARAGYQRVAKRFTEQRMIEEHDRIYREVVQSTRHSR
jgi:glycosyltransferase involved in cell wall biosynthesis